MTWAMKTRDLLWQGREEGREESREEGIKILVDTLKEFSVTPAAAAQTLADKFGLLQEDAEKKVAQYWGQ